MGINLFHLGDPYYTYISRPQLQVIGGQKWVGGPKTYPMYGNGKIRNWFNRRSREVVNLGKHLVQHPEYLRKVYNLYKSTAAPLIKGVIQAQIGKETTETLENVGKKVIEKGLSSIEGQQKAVDIVNNSGTDQPFGKHPYEEAIGYGKNGRGKRQNGREKRQNGRGKLAKSYDEMTNNEKAAVQGLDRNVKNLAEQSVLPIKDKINEKAQIIFSQLLASRNR